MNYDELQRLEIGKHATIEPSSYQVPGHTVPTRVRFPALSARASALDVMSRMILRMRAR